MQVIQYPQQSRRVPFTETQFTSTSSSQINTTRSDTKPNLKKEIAADLSRDESEVLSATRNLLKAAVTYLIDFIITELLQNLSNPNSECSTTRPAETPPTTPVTPSSTETSDPISTGDLAHETSTDENVPEPITSEPLDTPNTPLTNAADSVAKPLPMATVLKNSLIPNPDGNYHEEQLAHGITLFLLQRDYGKAAPAYEKTVKEFMAKPRASFEDAVKVGLKAVVSSNLISRSNAETIHGKAFRAAQLDKNLDTLFDDKGGAGDTTIAARDATYAIRKARETLTKIENKEIAAPKRSLDAASNAAPHSSSATASAQTLSASSSDERSGFLWKPISEKNGKLVTVLPKSLTGSISKVSLLSNGETLESGLYSGVANGEREHFRFKKPGASYPSGTVVRVTTKNGETIDFPVPNTGTRFEG